MTAAGAGRALALPLAVALLVAAAPGAAQAPATQAAPAAAPLPPPDYVDHFCLPLAGGFVADEETGAFLRQWNARPQGSGEAAAAQPVDVSAPGQLIRFTEAGAPSVLLDNRRGVCSLVWPAAAVPPSALAILQRDTPPVGASGAPTPWRRVKPGYGGAPPPPKFILRLRGSEASGVCAVRRDDLRLRDGSVASMLQLAPCRLAAGESTTDG